MFGLVFPGRSFPIDASSFTQIDPLHWVLDVPGDRRISQLCIFLLNNLALPPNKALAVYLRSHSSSPFVFCGAVHAGCPSAALTLPWPVPAEAPILPANTAAATGVAEIGVALEDLATLPQAAVDPGTQVMRMEITLRF